MRMALEFAKKDQARFISHLDLQRAFSRAVRRSGLPVMLSQGYNPHYQMSFASALSVGMESVCECVEMRMSEAVTPETFLLDIGRALPPGLQARRAVMLREGAPRLMAALREAEYCLTLNPQAKDSVAACVGELLSRDEIIGEKVSKGVKKPIEIRGLIRKLAVTPDGLVMRLMASQERSLRPDILLAVIERQTGSLGRQLLRTGLYAYVNGEPVSLLEALS